VDASTGQREHWSCWETSTLGDKDNDKDNEGRWIYFGPPQGFHATLRCRARLICSPNGDLEYGLDCSGKDKHSAAYFYRVVRLRSGA